MVFQFSDLNLVGAGFKGFVVETYLRSGTNEAPGLGLKHNPQAFVLSIEFSRSKVSQFFQLVSVLLMNKRRFELFKVFELGCVTNLP
jgi:hypothetical protein